MGAGLSECVSVCAYVCVVPTNSSTTAARSLPPLIPRTHPTPQRARHDTQAWATPMSDGLAGPRSEDEGKRWSGAGAAQQRRMHHILEPYPTTAIGAQFDLLCCQPEPFPGTLTARMPRLPSRDPCRPTVRLGDTNSMRYIP